MGPKGEAIAIQHTEDSRRALLGAATRSQIATARDPGAAIRRHAGVALVPAVLRPLPEVAVHFVKAISKASPLGSRACIVWPPFFVLRGAFGNLLSAQFVIARRLECSGNAEPKFMAP